jgi:flagellar motor switch protein FliG
MSGKSKKVSGPMKAAIVMLALDQENTKNIFGKLSEDEIKDLSSAMATLGSVAPELIDRAVEEFKTEVTTKMSVVGNLETTERLLEGVLGKEKVAEILDHIQGPLGKNTWDKLTNVNEDLLAAYLKNEHPQTIALILSKISPSTAAKVLGGLSEELVFEVMNRMLNMESVKKEVLENMENVLRSDFISTLSKVQKHDSNEMMAEIFNNFDRNSEAKYMKMLEDRLPEKADKVKELMFTFDDLVKLTPADIQGVLRNVDKTKFTLALKGANEKIRELFIGGMSQRAAKILIEDMEAMGPVRLKDVDEAQSAIVGTVKEMVENEEIVLATGEGEDEFIE